MISSDIVIEQEIIVEKALIGWMQQHELLSTLNFQRALSDVPKILPLCIVKATSMGEQIKPNSGVYKFNVVVGVQASASEATQDFEDLWGAVMAQINNENIVDGLLDQDLYCYAVMRRASQYTPMNMHWVRTVTLEVVAVTGNVSFISQRGITSINQGATYVDVLFDEEFVTVPTIVQCSVQMPDGTGSVITASVDSTLTTVNGFRAYLSGPPLIAGHVLVWSAWTY
mgnify:CR=1 FL=1